MRTEKEQLIEVIRLFTTYCIDLIKQKYPKIIVLDNYESEVMVKPNDLTFNPDLGLTVAAWERTNRKYPKYYTFILDLYKSINTQGWIDEANKWVEYVGGLKSYTCVYLCNDMFVLDRYVQYSGLGALYIKFFVHE